MKLYAPFTYHEASPEEKLDICNGCGAKGGVNVPDSMWGLYIGEACNIHDWMFNEGKSLADFYFSNAVFIMNLSIIIVCGGNAWLAPLRLMRATKYFVAVQSLGEDAYWEDNLRNDVMDITYKGSFK